MKEQYHQLNSFIVDHIGGAGNIKEVTHCMTRLRFTLHDNGLADIQALAAAPGVLGAQLSNNQLQVIIGTTVGDVYDELMQELAASDTQSPVHDKRQTDRKQTTDRAVETDEPVKTTEPPHDTDTDTDKDKTKQTVLNRILATITKIITPVLGVLMGCSLVLGLQSILVATGVIHSGDGTYVILNAIGNSIFTFFPILLGYTAAKAFGSDGFIGMIVGASMVFPNLVADLSKNDPLFTLFAGTPFATDVHSTFLGVPIIFPENGYTSTVIPIILAMFFISKFELFLKKKLPHATQFTFVPFLTILVGVVATVMVLGPIANLLSDAITVALQWLYALSPVIAGAVVGLLYTPLVILGLHWPLVAIGINNLSTLGSDFIMPLIYVVPLAQMAVVLAVWLRSRNTKTRQICAAAMISDFFCIIEPSIYGVTLPVKRRFIITCLGSMIGGIIVGAFHVVNYASTIGVLGIVGFVNPKTGDMANMLIVIAASLITMLCSFLAAFFTEKKEDIANVD